VSLTFDEKRRYARHFLLDEIGETGQQTLKHSSVLIIGAGGLGAASISYLAAAGIGRLGIVDDDLVELSNLNRQIIHENGDIGRKKVESAADRISEINPDCKITVYSQRFKQNGSAELLANYDLILDGTDSFPTRFAIAEAAHSAGIPLISAAVQGFTGQMSTFKGYLGDPHPCYRCFIPELPHTRDDCAELGVIGPLVGIMGSMQAMEAIKELLGIGESLSGRLLRYNALRGAWKESRLVKDSACPLCS
jgi:adenylyltransferase/sulfurtransferase